MCHGVLRAILVYSISRSSILESSNAYTVYVVYGTQYTTYGIEISKYVEYGIYRYGTVIV